MRKHRILVLVSMLAIVGMLMAACAPGAAPTATPAKPAAAPTPTAVKPKAGGILKVLNRPDPPHFDMHQQTPTVALLALSPNYSLLVQRDPADDNKVIPDLAEKWEVSADGKVYTFRLRQGVKWHDGKPFTSADAAISLDRIINPPKGIVSAWKELFPGVDKIETPDEFTLKVTLKQPQASFVDHLAFDPIAMYPKHVLDEKGDMKKVVVGTGPFKFKEFTPGVSFEMVKNGDYYMKDRPYLDGIKEILIKDVAAQMAALRTGQVQLLWPYATDLLGKDFDLLKKEGKLVAQSIPVPGTPAVIPNCNRPPWNDHRVRRAAYLAIDHQTAVSVVAFGYGKVGWFMMPGTPWAISDEELLKKPGYRQPKDQDIAEAKKLLAEAGFPTGLSTTLVFRSDPEQVTQAEFMQAQLKNVGISGKLEGKEVGAYKELLQKGEFDITPYYSSAAQDTPDGWLGPQFVTKAGQNYGSFSNKRFDELFLKQSQELDLAKRKAMVLEMQQILDEEAAVVPLYWDVKTWVWWPEVKGFTPPSVFKRNMKFRDVWLAQ